MDVSVSPDPGASFVSLYCGICGVRHNVLVFRRVKVERVEVFILVTADEEADR